LTKTRFIPAALIGAALSAAILAACGGGDSGDADPTPTSPARTASATPRTEASATPEPSAATTEPAPAASATSAPPQPSATTPPGQPPAPTLPPPAPPTPPPPPPPPASGITIVARDIAFIPEVARGTAGPVSITLDNQDAEVPHDIVVYNSSGGEVARTEIFNGPARATVTFDAAPGRYAYKCSVHPQQMTGVLTLQ
jgi:plastocyanin